MKKKSQFYSPLYVSLSHSAGRTLSFYELPNVGHTTIRIRSEMFKIETVHSLKLQETYLIWCKWR